MADNVTFDIPAELAEFCSFVNKQDAVGGVSRWAALGRLRLLAKSLNAFADELDAAGYVPPVAKAEVARYERLATSVGDRELSATYRAKAREVSKQIREESA